MTAREALEKLEEDDALLILRVLTEEDGCAAIVEIDGTLWAVAITTPPLPGES